MDVEGSECAGGARGLLWRRNTEGPTRERAGKGSSTTSAGTRPRMHVLLSRSRSRAEVALATGGGSSTSTATHRARCCSPSPAESRGALDIDDLLAVLTGASSCHAPNAELNLMSLASSGSARPTAGLTSARTGLEDGRPRWTPRTALAASLFLGGKGKTAVLCGSRTAEETAPECGRPRRPPPLASSPSLLTSTTGCTCRSGYRRPVQAVLANLFGR